VNEPVLRKDYSCAGELLTREMRSFDWTHWWRTVSMHHSGERITFNASLQLGDIEKGSVHFTRASSSCEFTAARMESHARRLKEMLAGVCHEDGDAEICSTVRDVPFFEMMREVEAYSHRRRQLDAMQCHMSDDDNAEMIAFIRFIRSMFVRAQREAGKAEAEANFDIAVAKLQYLGCHRKACEPSMADLREVLFLMENGPDHPMQAQTKNSVHDSDIIAIVDKTVDTDQYHVLKSALADCVSVGNCGDVEAWGAIQRKILRRQGSGYNATDAVTRVKDSSDPSALVDVSNDLTESPEDSDSWALFQPKPLPVRILYDLVMLIVVILMLIISVAILPIVIVVVILIELVAKGVRLAARREGTPVLNRGL